MSWLIGGATAATAVVLVCALGSIFSIVSDINSLQKEVYEEMDVIKVHSVHYWLNFQPDEYSLQRLEFSKLIALSYVSYEEKLSPETPFMIFCYKTRQNVRKLSLKTGLNQ